MYYLRIIFNTNIKYQAATLDGKLWYSNFSTFYISWDTIRILQVYSPSSWHTYILDEPISKVFINLLFLLFGTFKGSFLASSLLEVFDVGKAWKTLIINSDVQVQLNWAARGKDFYRLVILELTNDIRGDQVVLGSNFD